MIRHLITSEYPPQPGGVSDYTKLIASGLVAAGDEVHVWCPSLELAIDDTEIDAADRVLVHRDFGSFAPTDLRRVGRRLDQFPTPRSLLLQWVPQGYGFRSINLPFCLWLWRRAKLKHDRLEIMVHEPFLAFREGSRKQDLAATVHRLMVATLLGAASQVWVSIPDWEKSLRPFVRGNKSFDWLPVPSTIPIVDDPEGSARVRAQYASAGVPLIGHFGAYDRYLTELMLKLIPSLLNGQDKPAVVLLGKGSLELRDRLVELRPEFFQSVHATGALSAGDISRHISACDVMLQPYQDGVSGRRTSVMTALSHGVPVVTTEGKATEHCWTESHAVKLSKVDDAKSIVEAVQCLLGSEGMRRSMANLGTALYRERFDVRQAISALRGSSAEG